MQMLSCGVLSVNRATFWSCGEDDIAASFSRRISSRGQPQNRPYPHHSLVSLRGAQRRGNLLFCRGCPTIARCRNPRSPLYFSERSMVPNPQSRRVLGVFPRYAKSFGTFDNAYPLLGVKAFMPPQGLLVIAAYLPKHWQVRVIDENVRPASDSDYRWADVVMTSGMHIQRNQINAINARAHAFGKVTVLGGPSVSGCPEHYPDFDYLHIGEMGDATDSLFTTFEASVARPAEQVRVETKERLPLSDFPTPAYHLAPMSKYFLANVQFSSGCPYRCE